MVAYRGVKETRCAVTGLADCTAYSLVQGLVVSGTSNALFNIMFYEGVPDGRNDHDSTIYIVFYMDEG
jgi:hypothetical protein